ERDRQFKHINISIRTELNVRLSIDTICEYVERSERPHVDFICIYSNIIMELKSLGDQIVYKELLKDLPSTAIIFTYLCDVVHCCCLTFSRLTFSVLCFDKTHCMDNFIRKLIDQANVTNFHEPSTTKIKQFKTYNNLKNITQIYRQEYKILFKKTCVSDKMFTHESVMSKRHNLGMLPGIYTIRFFSKLHSKSDIYQSCLLKPFDKIYFNESLYQNTNKVHRSCNLKCKMIHCACLLSYKKEKNILGDKKPDKIKYEGPAEGRLRKNCKGQ
ncbi:Hypothetical predicted protein, partial [Mytilus galloprovincialis]